MSNRSFRAGPVWLAAAVIALVGCADEPSAGEDAPDEASSSSGEEGSSSGSSTGETEVEYDPRRPCECFGDGVLCPLFEATDCGEYQECTDGEDQCNAPDIVAANSAALECAFELLHSGAAGHVRDTLWLEYGYEAGETIIVANADGTLFVWSEHTTETETTVSPVLHVEAPSAEVLEACNAMTPAGVAWRCMTDAIKSATELATCQTM